MKYYLKDILPSLKKYSASLDQSAFLVDKPWVVANKEGKYEKLIFRKDGRVHLNDGSEVKIKKSGQLGKTLKRLIYDLHFVRPAPDSL